MSRDGNCGINGGRNDGSAPGGHSHRYKCLEFFYECLSLFQFGWFCLIIDLLMRLFSRPKSNANVDENSGTKYTANLNELIPLTHRQEAENMKCPEVDKVLAELLINDTNRKPKTSCLHLAILQNNVDRVRAYLEQLSDLSERYDLVNEECNKELTATMFGSDFIKARLPLSIAVLVANDDIVELLIQNGAELDGQDSDGYSLLHTIVLMSKKYEDKADKMYSLILDKYMLVWWKKKLEAKNHKLKHDMNDKMEAGYYLLNQKTKSYKMTPIALAAQIGSKSMLDRIINTEYVYRFTLIEAWPSGVAYYDISDIVGEKYGYDTADDESTALGLSVVEILLKTETDKSLECLDIPLLEDILSTKWNNYFKLYVFIILAYFSYLGLLTSTMFEINMSANYTHGNASCEITNSSAISSRHYIVLIGAIFFLVYGFASLASNVVTSLVVKFRGKIWRDILLSFFCICFSVTVIVRFILYQTGNPLQVPVFGCSAVLGWSFSIFFLSGFRPTAKFSVMIVRLLFRNLFIFGICFFLICTGFAAAIAANMNYRTKPSMPYSDWKFTFFTLFRAIVGLIDIDELFDASELPVAVYGFNIVMFTIYFLFTCVFLLNMLIASMSDSYFKISKKKDLFWKKLRSQNIRLIERKMPKCVQRTPNKIAKEELQIRTIVRPNDTNKEKGNRDKADSNTSYTINENAKRIVCWHRLKFNTTN